MKGGKREMASQRLYVVFLPSVFSRLAVIRKLEGLHRQIVPFSSQKGLEIRIFFTRFSLFPVKSVAGHSSVQQTKLRLSPP